MFIMTGSGTIQILFALELGADILLINLMTTITSSMTILLQVPFGILSDKLGRKTMLVYTAAVRTGGVLIRMFATQPIHLLYASILGGFAGGEFFPIMQSMIADKTEHRERQEAMSVMFIFSSIGMFSGPAFFSFFLTLPQIILRNVYQVNIVLEIVYLIYIITQLPETKPKVSESSKISYSHSVTELLRNKSFLSITLVGFFFWFFRQTLTTYIKIYAKVELDLSNAEVATFDVFSNSAIFIIRVLSATLLTKVSFRPAIISFMVLGGLTSVAATFANSYLFIVIIFFLEGTSYGATRIMQNVLVANVSSSQNRGVANSVNQLFQSAAGLTRIFTTPIVDYAGFSPVFVLAGISAFIAAAIPLVRKSSFKSETEINA